MSLNVILLFLSCMAGLAFIKLAVAKKDSTTYALRNGVAFIRWMIDRKDVSAYYVDVTNPMNKRIFQCVRTDPVINNGQFDGKYQFDGSCSNGIISFLVFNVTDGDAGQYTSVSYLTQEVVGSQLLVVFAPFPRPDISRQKNTGVLDDSSLTMLCQVNTTGTPPEHLIPVSYTWRRNGQAINSSAKYMVEHSKLQITYLHRSDLGDKFTCLVWNDYDAISPESTALEIKQYSIHLGSCETTCIFGSCELYGDKFRCVCKKGWAGLNCSIEVDECSSNPCYRGTCYDKYTEYLCICTPGWTGKQCEININECASGPCINGGICNDLENDHTCQCTPGWTGENCEKAHGNSTSTTGLIPASVGGGCVLIALFITILCLCYRKHKPRVNQGINQMHYWTIDDEQLYDSRRRVKLNLPTEAKDNNPAVCNTSLHAAGGKETVKHDTETDTDGYIHPTFSAVVNSEFDGSNVLRISQNSSSEQDYNGFHVVARNTNSFHCNTRHSAEQGMETVKDGIQPYTDGYLQAVITNSSLGQNCNPMHVEANYIDPTCNNPCLHADRKMENIKDGIETDIDGYLQPTIAVKID